jgi:fructose-1,6-bisphosphatase I
MDFKEFLSREKVDDALGGILSGVCGIFPAVAQTLKSSAGEGAGTKNVFGENQLAIDVRANALFLDYLKESKDVASIASEELDHEDRGKGTGDAVYSVAFDPLDGSSLVDVNLAVGSIFGIYRGAGFIGRKGGEQVAAIIAVYGPRLTFMVTLGNGVFEFLFDEKSGVFNMSGEVKFSGEGKIFAPGNLRACSSEEWYLEALEYWSKNGYTLRYSGGMVPDVNQVLKKGGGIFSYPGYKGKPEGKLRLLYECAPVAMLVENAGGAAVYGKPGEKVGRILEMQIAALDLRTPIFIGTKEEVERTLSFMR